MNFPACWKFPRQKYSNFPQVLLYLIFVNKSREFFHAEKFPEQVSLFRNFGGSWENPFIRTLNQEYRSEDSLNCSVFRIQRNSHCCSCCCCCCYYYSFHCCLNIRCYCSFRLSMKEYRRSSFRCCYCSCHCCFPTSL